MPLHSHIDGYNKEDKVTSVGKDIEQFECSYIDDRIVKFCSCFGKQFGSYLKC